MTDDRGPLSMEIDRLAFECKLREGKEATHILLPRKAPSVVKEFVKALCDEIEGIGTPPEVFDRFVRQEVPAQFRGLDIAMYDGDRLIVGGADYL
jgi:hypothetical protein